MERPGHDPLALVRVPAKAAAEVRAHAGPAARPLPEPGEGPRAFLDRLLAGKKFPEAIRFLAFALPRREAVWWGCVCVPPGQSAPLALRVHVARGHYLWAAGHVPEQGAARPH
jgi:hypothetical protein